MAAHNVSAAKGNGAQASGRITLWRRMLASLICLALVLFLGLHTALAYNVYSDYFVTLPARTLAMGGAATALVDPAAAFYNPAALSGIRRLTLDYNHSARHFPGSQSGGQSEWDQLDGDSEFFVVPLPLSTYAHGLTFADEMGYDFRYHPADGSLGYPRERLAGQEDYDSFATSLGLPFAWGCSLRRHVSHFTPDPADELGEPWLRRGEGFQWGILARVWPGLDYGLSNLDFDCEWTLLGTPATTTKAPRQFNSEHLTSRQGWALHPTGWLTFTNDTVIERHVFDRDTGFGITDPTGLGVVHLGNSNIQRSHRGMELSLGALGKFRLGNYDSHPTWGCALNLGGLWLNYTEIKDLLPEIVGAGNGFGNVHIYGAQLELW